MSKYTLLPSVPQRLIFHLILDPIQSDFSSGETNPFIKEIFGELTQFWNAFFVNLQKHLMGAKNWQACSNVFIGSFESGEYK